MRVRRAPGHAHRKRLAAFMNHGLPAGSPLGSSHRHPNVNAVPATLRRVG